MKPTNPLTYTEAMLASIISTHLDPITEWEGVAVHTGQDDGKRTVPCVIAYAAAANTPAELPDFLRNYEVQCTLIVESKADPQPGDPDMVAGIAKHRDLVQDVMDALRNVSAIKAAAAAAGHKVYDVEPQANQPQLNDENRTFQTEISMVLTMVFDLPPT